MGSRDDAKALAEGQRDARRFARERERSELRIQAGI
jgi:hypothetical protein